MNTLHLRCEQGVWNRFVRPTLRPGELVLAPCDEANGGVWGGVCSQHWAVHAGQALSCVGWLCRQHRCGGAATTWAPRSALLLHVGGSPAAESLQALRLCVPQAPPPPAGPCPPFFPLTTLAGYPGARIDHLQQDANCTGRFIR